MKRIVYSLLSLATLLLLHVSLAAEDRKPAEGSPRGERKPEQGAPRGERPAGERGAGGTRPEFPAEIKLTDEQQAKLKEVQGAFNDKIAELSKKRAGILTDEQKSAQAEAYKKIREGNLGRQEASDLVTAAMKLSAEQKTQLEAVDQEAQQLRREFEAQKAALLTDEQKTTLRKIEIARSAERQIGIPGDIKLSDEQKAGLKALQEELGPKLIEATEKRAAIMTEERMRAREAAFKEARDSGKDRQATMDAVNAALNLSDAEKAQLAEAETGLREVNQLIQDRKESLLTTEQKEELKKRFGEGRPRN